MHLIIDENLTPEQLQSPKKYIYQMCEMYGWDQPEDIFALKRGYVVSYTEKSLAKAKKRQRLIRDACARLGTYVVKDGIAIDGFDYVVCSVIPYYSKS